MDEVQLYIYVIIYPPVCYSIKRLMLGIVSSLVYSIVLQYCVLFNTAFMYYTKATLFYHQWDLYDLYCVQSSKGHLAQVNFTTGHLLKESIALSIEQMLSDGTLLGQSTIKSMHSDILSFISELSIIFHEHKPLLQYSFPKLSPQTDFYISDTHPHVVGEGGRQHATSMQILS